LTRADVGTPPPAGSLGGFALYPVLAAVYAAVRVAAGNAFDVTLSELAAVVAVCMVAALVIDAVLFAALSRRVPSPAIALIATIAIGWLFDVEPLADSGLLIGLRSRDALVVLSLFAIALALWLLRTRRDLHAASRTVRIVAIVLPLIAAGQFIAARVAIRRAVNASPFLARATQPLPLPGHVPAPPRRDVYLLVLDQYGSADVLAGSYGFDNQPFLDSLTALGLTVTRGAHSNYGWTPLSLASMLSGAHVREMESDSVARRAPWDVLYTLIRRSPVLAAYERAGYQVYLTRSAFFTGTQDSEVAETYLSSDTRSPLMRLARSGLARAVMHGTVVGRLGEKAGRSWMPGAVELSPFAGTIELAARPGPKFVFAHSLVSHEPFVFDSECRPTRRLADEASMYPDQVRCTNRQVIRTVRAIEARDPAAVIIVMADHGPMIPGIGAGAVAEAITRPQAIARFGALRATRLPPGMTIPDSTTPVNVIRRVIGVTLGVELPDVADSAYWSTLDAVDHFVAVDSLLSH
jgi:hypothetical protein